MVNLIDFENPENNLFRAVNQFTVEYTNNGQKENRRPDVILFVNGMPLCVIELKNPADANATIYDAWEQIHIRYCAIFLTCCITARWRVFRMESKPDWVQSARLMSISTLGVA